MPRPTGYVRIDHRGTQGVAVRNGRPALSGKDGRLVERDTALCCHCQAVVTLGKATEMCQHCGRARCAKEACAICTPFMRLVDEAEDREYHRQQLWRAL